MAVTFVPRYRIHNTVRMSRSSLTGKHCSEQEWGWSVTAMREAAEYAKECSDMAITVEAVNRFETHFLSIAAEV